jgi:hypothetical protein
MHSPGNNLVRRLQNAIGEKSVLLKDVEQPEQSNSALCSTNYGRIADSGYAQFITAAGCRLRRFLHA